MIATAVGAPVAGQLTGWLDFADRPARAWIVSAVVAVGCFAVATVTGVATRLRETWTDRLADGIDVRIQRLASGFTRSYLARVAAATEYVENKGLATRADFTLSLGEIFVTLALDPESVHRLSANPLGRDGELDAKPTRGDVWTWLQRAGTEGRALAIVGPPGCGKTTLLRHVAFGLTRSRRMRGRPRLVKVPVLIALRDHKSRFESGVPSLAELVRLELADMELSEPRGWVETQLRRGRLLVMLDGMDELATETLRRQVSGWVEVQRRNYPDVVFAITSRPFGYQDSPLEAAIVVEVQRLEREQIMSFIQRWYRATEIRAHGADNPAAQRASAIGARELGRAIEESTHLAMLARNPLLLTMIANVHYYRGALPGTRAELYHEVCEVFLGKRLLARGLDIELSAPQRRLALEHLAIAMMTARTRTVDAETAQRQVVAPLRRFLTRLGPARFLQVIEESSGLLIESEAGRYSFAHLTLQEYLAAGHLARNPGAVDLAAVVGDVWWHETLRLYAAQAEDATGLVKACVQGARGDVGLLRLAMDCLIAAKATQPEARTALDLLAGADEGEGGIAAGDRRLAGAASLLRRRPQAELRGMDPAVYGGAVTNLEYQAFVDDGHGEHAPPHWPAGGFVPGTASRPVTGLRHGDAMAFCQWLRRLVGDEASYRLPLLGELGADRLLGPAPLTEAAVTSIWCETFVEHVYESHGMRLRFSLTDPSLSHGVIRGRLTSGLGSSVVTGILFDDIGAVGPALSPDEQRSVRQRFADLESRAGKLAEADFDKVVAAVAAAAQDLDALSRHRREPGAEQSARARLAALVATLQVQSGDPAAPARLRAAVFGYIVARLRAQPAETSVANLSLVLAPDPQEATVQPADQVAIVGVKPEIRFDVAEPGALELQAALLSNVFGTWLRTQLFGDGRTWAHNRLRLPSRTRAAAVRAERPRRVVLPGVRLPGRPVAADPGRRTTNPTLTLHDAYEQLVVLEAFRRGVVPTGGALFVVRESAPVRDSVLIRSPGEPRWELVLKVGEAPVEQAVRVPEGQLAVTVKRDRSGDVGIELVLERSAKSKRRGALSRRDDVAE